ncbi:hypothetical protein QMK17_18255 [Rhodococcus sp. G-MC3]|uniref:hypothetical protein n=1 Tax=Rhodococcus sp. G-MC3 TaxID=3046209 RepID=UPI0024BB4F95|nr:hypothetical protein [Rhodococcus sp. G-MC3]MDJ0395273.1 hypothetical protein [Rhodococcus sp. G-MC3]
MNSQRTALRNTDMITADSSAIEIESTANRPSINQGGKYSTWFGPEDARLFGTVHVPVGGRARGSVVLCPPLGKEQVDSYRGLTLLAQKLCARGLLVLRFDYLGAGDSFGAQDEANIVGHWIGSIVTAVDFVRSCGPSDVALVGLRAGALLASTAASQCGPLTAAVLWDPVVRGRSYLHEQRALYSVSVTTDSDADPRVSIIGAVLHEGVAAEFAALDISKHAALACPVLVATRQERGDSKPVRSLVRNQNAEEHTLSDHDLFLEPSDFEVVLPSVDIAHLASWIDDRFDHARSAVTLQVVTEAEVGDGNLSVTETMESIGPDGLFGIRSSSPTCVPGGPTLVLYPTANEHRVGPVRMWVEISRELAAQGVSVLRFDRRGTGESGVVLDGEITKLYSDEGNVDALNAVRFAGSSPRNVMVSGMCSGSWYSSFAARELGVSSAVLLNTLDWTTRRLEFVKRSSMHNEKNGAISTALDRLHNFGVTVKNALQTSLPYPVWLWLGTRGLIQVPEISLSKLEAKSVRTTVLLSPTDTAWFVANRGPEGMDRLRKTRAAAKRGATDRRPTEVKSFVSGDHSLYGRDLRETVRTELLQAVSDAFGVKIDAHAPPVPVDWTSL